MHLLENLHKIKPDLDNKFNDIKKMILQTAKHFNQILKNYPEEANLCKKLNFVFWILKDNGLRTKVFEDLLRKFDQNISIKANFEHTDLLNLKNNDHVIFHSANQEENHQHFF